MNILRFWESLSSALGQSDLVQKLGWMLLHGIWQGAACALGLWIFLSMTRDLRGSRWSAIRYNAACAAMLAVVLASAATMGWLLRSAPNISNAPAVVMPDLIQSAPAFTNAVATPTIVSHKFNPRSLIPVAVCLWAVGVAMQSLWQCAGWLRVARLRRGAMVVDPTWIAILRQTSARLQIHRAVRIVIGAIDVPAVIGAFRPVIIVPLALLNELSPQQAEAVLAHELAHVRRWDYAVNLIQTAVETLYFHHPAVWWISRQIRRERENCCDDIAAHICGDVRRYADALVELEERRGPAPRLALAATDGLLIQRIRRLLSAPSPRGNRAGFITVALIGIICSISPVVFEKTSRARAQAVSPATQPSAGILSPQQQESLREGDEDAAAHKHLVVRVTIGKDGFISVDGGVGNWDTLRDSLAVEQPAVRADLVIALSAETPDVPVGDYLNAEAAAAKLVKDFGLAYVSEAGVEYQQPGATTRPDGVYYIGGAARRSGVYALGDQRVTVTEALIAAGGVDGADNSHAWLTIIRRLGGEKRIVVQDKRLDSIQHGEASDIYLEPNDTLEVSITPPIVAPEPMATIHILGLVRHPGAYAIENRRVTVLEQLADAQGLLGVDDSHAWIYLIRRENDSDKVVIHGDRVDSIEKGGASDIVLMPGDRLIVTSAPYTPTTEPEQTTAPLSP
ncbi:MAG: M56 family metallopeptidase [Tepidisphaeraceae bacterium]|jgi:beta-lactamase regulating signal transducer with metallopeptidase domain/protein involved in polysaccharide export with SLBB domain